MTCSARAMLAKQDVSVIYTRNQRVLRGRNARWYPDRRVIAMHADLRGKRWRCSLMHELGHVVLNHPAACGNDFFDQRLEAEADEFAARVLLPDLDLVGTELATCGSYGHAATTLGVILDLLEVRLKTLTETERTYLNRAVWSIHEGVGA